jgi:exopolysaccharide production protein ExoQ
MDQNPLHGTGFGAFWNEGSPYAEELWAAFGVRGGFNFHNLWCEMGVELGYLGIIVALLTLLIIAPRESWLFARNDQ